MNRSVRSGSYAILFFLLAAGAYHLSLQVTPAPQLAAAAVNAGLFPVVPNAAAPALPVMPTSNTFSAAPTVALTTYKGGVVLGASTVAPLYATPAKVSTNAGVYVTQAQLDAQLQEIRNNFQSLMLQQSVVNSFPASGGYTNTIAQTNKIDQLNGTKISNATISNSNLSGGTISGVTLTGVTGLTVADIPVDTDVDVFIIAGQSNAQGYEYGVVATGSTSPIVTPGTALQYWNGVVSAANDPVGNAFYASAWPQFAISYYAKTGRKVAFVPTAVPGSALDVNSPSNGTASNWSPSGTYFNSSVSSTTDAMAAFRAAGYTPHLVGVLWDQGENDADAINAAAPVTGAMYTIDMQTLIANYRTSLSDTNLPFYIFETGKTNFADTAGYRTIRTAQEATASSTINTFIVFRNAVDFWTRGLMNGSYHYSQAGYNEMGRVGAENIANRTTVAHWVDQSNNAIFNPYTGGNVGIGTSSSPTAKLTVWGSGTTASTSVFSLVNAASTTLFTVNNSGNIGIGTTSPSATFTLQSSSLASYSASDFLLTNPNAVGWSSLVASNDLGYRTYLGTVGSNSAFSYNRNRSLLLADGDGMDIAAVQVNSTTTPSLRFFTNGFTSSGYERMRIDSIGRVGIGTTTPWRILSVNGTVGLAGLTGATGAGSLCLSSNNEVVYNSGSDSCLASVRALKHDITTLTLSGTSTVAALQPVSFVYNYDASSTVRYGFIAEDTAHVDPHLTTYDAQGNLSGIDDRSVISIVVKAVQEMLTQMNSLASVVSGFADSFTTRQLCVGDDSGKTCITRAQLDQLLAVQAAVNNTPASVSTSTTTPPTVHLVGNSPAHIAAGSTYIDQGAVATDALGNHLGTHEFLNGVAVDSVSLDTSTTTTASIDYVAVDTWGNTATGTRTVVVDPQ
jgi:hypothetical protein